MRCFRRTLLSLTLLLLAAALLASPAPSYGNAQDRLEPALAPYRDDVFLACNTGRRDALEELENSLRMMQTGHFDLYQLHAITSDENVQQA